jgi:hypothetical protein
MQKLEKIRKHYGRYVNQTPKIAQEINENVSHPFEMHLILDNAQSQRSLSVFSKPIDILNKRPQTALT